MKNYKENFSDYLPGYKGNVNSSIHSRSFLDSPNNNLYNSTYCNLLPDTNNGFIQKRNFDFDGDIQLLDDFFYDPNQSNENDCLQECKKNKYCAAYKFDSTSETNKCKLINNYPNKLKQSNNSNIGYRVNKNNLNFSKLNDEQKKNVYSKCGTQSLSKKYNINEDSIDECVKPELTNNILSGYNVDAECLWDKWNTDEKKTINRTKVVLSEYPISIYSFDFRKLNKDDIEIKTSTKKIRVEKSINFLTTQYKNKTIKTPEIKVHNECSLNKYILLQNFKEGSPPYQGIKLISDKKPFGESNDYYRFGNQYGDFSLEWFGQISFDLKDSCLLSLINSSGKLVFSMCVGSSTNPSELIITIGSQKKKIKKKYITSIVGATGPAHIVISCNSYDKILKIFIEGKKYNDDFVLNDSFTSFLNPSKIFINKESSDSKIYGTINQLLLIRFYNDALNSDEVSKLYSAKDIVNLDKNDPTRISTNSIPNKNIDNIAQKFYGLIENDKKFKKSIENEPRSINNQKIIQNIKSIYDISDSPVDGSKDTIKPMLNIIGIESFTNNKNNVNKFIIFIFFILLILILYFLNH